jgi:hypothetical protein
LADTHKKQRAQFCKQYQRDLFSNVVFSDEKPWVLGKTRRVFWRRPGGARPVHLKTKYPPKLQCWGGISFKGKTKLSKISRPCTYRKGVEHSGDETVKALKRWITYEWEHLEQEVIDNAIHSMIKNIPLIIEANGEYAESKRSYRH